MTATNHRNPFPFRLSLLSRTTAPSYSPIRKPPAHQRIVRSLTSVTMFKRYRLSRHHCLSFNGLGLEADLTCSSSATAALLEHFGAQRSHDHPSLDAPFNPSRQISHPLLLQDSQVQMRCEMARFIRSLELLLMVGRKILLVRDLGAET